MSDEQLKGRLVLVLGGARSGKSTFAERLATKSDRSVAYIATATASDDEMRARIERHRSVRPAGWITIEEPLQLAQALRRSLSVADVIILDCITVWLSNWLLQGKDMDMDEVSAFSYESALTEINRLIETLATATTEKSLIVVSNEVGQGIVPVYPLGRVYRDGLGLVNQRLAASAVHVYWMIAGLGVDIKRLDREATL